MVDAKILTEEQKADAMARLIDMGTYEYMDYCKKRSDGKGYDLRSDNYNNGDMEIVSQHFLSVAFEAETNDVYGDNYEWVKRELEDMGIAI